VQQQQNIGVPSKKQNKKINHFQTTNEADFRYTTLFIPTIWNMQKKTVIGVP
jgi:hypothetical protein